MKRSLPSLLTRLARPVIGTTGVLLFLVVAAFLAVPPLAKYLIVKTVSEELGREAAIESVAFNPLTLSATLRGVSLKEKDSSEQAAGLGELHVNLELESIIAGGIVVDALRLVNPSVRIVRFEPTRFNFSDIVEKIRAKPPSEPVRFSLGNIELVGGTVDIDDRTVGKRHRVSDVRLAVPFLSNLPVDVDVRVQPAFEASVNGSKLGVGAQAKPFSETREAAVDVTLADIDLPTYFAYVPVELGVRLMAGKLDTNLKVSFAQPKNAAPKVLVSGGAMIRQVEATEPDGSPAARIPEMAVTIRSLDVFGRNLEVESVALKAPELHARRAKDSSIRLVHLFRTEKADGPAKPETPPDSPAPSESDAAWAFQVDEATIAAATVHVTDEVSTPPHQTLIQPLNATVRNLSSREGGKAGVAFDLATSAGDTIRHEGDVAFSPLAAQGRIELNGFKPGQYAGYYRHLLPFSFERGAVNVAGDYRFARVGGAPQLTLIGAKVEVKDLALKAMGDKVEFFQLAELAAEGVDFDLEKRTVVVGAVSTRDGKLRVSREADRTLNLDRLAKAGGGGSPEKGEPQWAVLVKKLDLAGYSVEFDDHSRADPVRLAAGPISLTADNLSTRKGSQSTFSLKAGLGKKGKLEANGAVRVEPLQASVKLDLNGFEITPLQPYFTDALNIKVLSGAIGARGSAVVSAGTDGAIRANYRGQAGVANLHTVDKDNSDDLIKWKSLVIGGIAANLKPLVFHADEVALSDYFARIIISPEGQLNLQQIVRRDEPAVAPQADPGQRSEPGSKKASAAEEQASEKIGAPQAASAPAAPAYDVKVKQVTLQGGAVDFSDRFIKPNYSANITELGGRVSDLSSAPGTTADVELRGRVTGTAPLEITGRINPLAKDLFLDIKAAARDIELSQLTPYSGKYAGYAIEKGKLSLMVGYKIENRKLEAENNLFLDQLTFGERIESPDATKLPVLLAVALLKNSRGEIDINLPIGGSLDDPEFSVGGLIVKVIVNLITKAVTAPFRLLAAAFGGGEELSYIEFEAGRDALTPETEKRLATLAKALNDRPGLKLEAAGRIDPTGDREGLRDALVERKVKAQKLDELSRKGEPAVSVDEITLGEEEYPKYLAAAYKKEKFPKPRNVIGLAKDLPAAEMKKLMLTHAQVSDDDLRNLANRRAQAAKDFLIKRGQVPAERIFLLASTAVDANDKQPGKASRVDFSLK